MFCKKCGNELSNGARFCGKCGAQVEQVAQVDLPTSAGNPNQFGFGFSVANLRNNRKMTAVYLSAAVLFILEIILWFSGTISISVLGYSESVSTSFFLSEANLGFLNVLTVLLGAFSAVMCIVLLFADINKHRRLIFQKVIAILNLCLYFFVSIAALSEGNSALSDVGFTFAGIIMILAEIGLIVLLFYTSSQTKKMN